MQKSIWKKALMQVHTHRGKWSWRLLPKPYIFHWRSFPSPTTSRMFLAFFKWPRSSRVLWGITEYQSDFVTPFSSLLGFPGGSDGKESACNGRRPTFFPMEAMTPMTSEKTNLEHRDHPSEDTELSCGTCYLSKLCWGFVSLWAHTLNSQGFCHGPSLSHPMSLLMAWRVAAALLPPLSKWLLWVCGTSFFTCYQRENLCQMVTSQGLVS